MQFRSLGTLFLSKTGQTESLVHLPDDDENYLPMLTWGYMAMPAPPSETGGRWRKTQDLRASHGIPEHAAAVRLHIKAKAKTIKWAPSDSLADIQVAVRGEGESGNECVHATASMKGGDNLPGEQISHSVVDAALPPDGRINIFTHPSIQGYGNTDLIVYLAGYWDGREPTLIQLATGDVSLSVVDGQNAGQAQEQSS